MRLTAVLTAAAAAYALFGASCLRLAVVHEDGLALSLGEGAASLLGALALAAASLRPHRAAAVVMVGTLPLALWFAATPWNSGPPFLLVSLVVPAAAGTAILARGKPIRVS